MQNNNTSVKLRRRRNPLSKDRWTWQHFFVRSKNCKFHPTGLPLVYLLSHLSNDARKHRSVGGWIGTYSSAVVMDLQKMVPSSQSINLKPHCQFWNQERSHEQIKGRYDDWFHLNHSLKKNKSRGHFPTRYFFYCPITIKKKQMYVHAHFIPLILTSELLLNGIWA